MKIQAYMTTNSVQSHNKSFIDKDH